MAGPLLPFWLAYRARNGREIRRRLPERQGIEATARPDGRLLWLHAASVGEVVSILPVLAALREAAPDATLLVTTGTVTSASLLAKRDAELGGGILHRFVPLDVPCWVERFLDHWRPDAGAFVESELWPNLVMSCRARHIPLLLLNARMSARSLARWNRAPDTARALLAAFHHVQARSPADAERFRALGARSVSAPGDLKFAAPALPADPDEVARIACPGRPVWLAASVHPEEAPIIAATHRLLSQRFSDLLSIVAPRHPGRAGHFVFDLNHTRRSAGQLPPAGTGIWLVDTMGELGLCYRLARIVLVGGSLFPHGGQNVLEPARLGCAVATGPYTGNFTLACAALEQAGAIARVADADAVSGWVTAMLCDPARCAQLGEAAQSAASQWRDLPKRSAQALLALMAA